MAENWYDKSIKQIEERLDTDLSLGLRREAVEKRRKVDGPNDVYPVTQTSFLTYLRHLLTDYTSILMLVTLLIAAVFEETENLLAMFLITVIYYGISLFLYVRSQRLLEGMGTYALPNAKVLRGGKLRMMKQLQLVRGDVIYLAAGDIVPCDARLVESEELEVLEVSVTSVTHAVRKDASFIDYHDLEPARQKNMVFASSIVTRGHGKAVCCEIGKDTQVCLLKKNLPAVSQERAEILDRIGSFCKRWSLVMTALILLLTVADILFVRDGGRGIFGSFMTGICLSVASMSEFYTAFATVVLACGVYAAVNKRKDVNRGALVKNTAKLEEIKSLTCLIVPKEAAFNVRDMRLGKVYANGDSFIPGEHGYQRNASRVLRYALLSTGLYGAGKLIENNRRGENIYSPEEEAILKAAEDCGEYNIGLEKRYPLLQHLGKNADNRFETSLVRYENGFFTALRGEYRAILPLCRYYTEDSRTYEMTPEKRNEFQIAAEQLARESYRVIAVASKDTIYNNLKRLSACQSDMTLEGFLAIREPTLPGAAKNVLRCRNAGIKVLMLCPDVSESNAILADSLGIASSPEKIVSGEELKKMKEGLFRANLDIYTVYQGLNLAQKRLLVRFLQEKGEKVGVLCSDLDEIILMKDADVGFSESITISDKAGKAGIDLVGRNVPVFAKEVDGAGGYGCEALKFVSDVIVSEADRAGTGGFNAMVDAILCSKSVYYNLYRMLKYAIVSQTARLALVILSMVFGITALSPVQILFCGLAVDFAALIVIAFERSGPPILKMPSNVGERLDRPLAGNPLYLLLGVFWATAAFLSVFLMNRYGIIADNQISCCLFVSFILTQLAMLNECKREQSVFDRNVRINGAYLAMLAALAAFFFLAFKTEAVGMCFSISNLSLYAVGGVAAVPILMTLICELYKAVTQSRKGSAAPSDRVSREEAH